MEDCAGLLGKTMNSALYWLSHLIDTLLAFCLLHHFTHLISCCGRRFCERLYRDRWSMRRTSLLLQLWGLEIRILHWESAFLLP